MKMFSETMIETITIEKPKIPEDIPSNLVSQWKGFNDDNILKIV